MPTSPELEKLSCRFSILAITRCLAIPAMALLDTFFLQRFGDQLADHVSMLPDSVFERRRVDGIHVEVDMNITATAAAVFNHVAQPTGDAGGKNRFVLMDKVELILGHDPLPPGGRVTHAPDCCCSGCHGRRGAGGHARGRCKTS